MDRRRQGATRIALTYVVLSAAWILVTDWWLGLGAGSVEQLTLVQTAKGLTFITLSGVVIFGLVRREQRALAATNAELERTLTHAKVLHRLLRHNLRNSCDVIQNSVDLLEAGRGDAQAGRDRIRRQATTMAAIAEKSQHLRDVIFDEGETAVEHDLAALVDESVAAVRREFPDATFSVDIDPSQRVRAHPRFAVAIEELLTNAVAHHDTAAPDVTVSAERDGDAVALRVSDTGPGLPENERRVLENGAENALAHSRGIGLWVVRFITTVSGGRLSVSSPSSEGTTVSIHLPAADA